ncbi:MAG: Crp/Fnr family transcriptional regulator [Limnochordales bacterium]|nr:Crp/Fnr family transcriptional regulator [Limnochordales bacterium]
MQFLATGAQTRQFSKGEVVFQAGQDPGLLFVVARGLVKVTRISASGREQVVRLLGPGDFYGELSLFLPQALAATGVALQDARVCLLARSHVRELLHRSPEASLKMLSALALRIMELETLAEQLAVHPVENRVAALLLKLAAARGDVAAPVPQGTVVELPLTQEEIAKLLGTSQETLSRKLHSLEDAGLIRLQGRRCVRLLDVNRLADRAEGL